MIENINGNIFSILITIFSVLIGSLITWFVTWKYYKKAGDELSNEAMELKKESEKLRIMMNMIGYVLEKPEDYSLKRDENGEIIGAFANMRAKI